MSGLGLLTLPKHKPILSRSACIRCGTCCKKGGPSFHLEDKPLIENGAILSKHLYTIRQGEQSYDNVKQRFIPAASDIIKIKGQKGSWTCCCFDAAKNECKIYAFRPLECRVLKCWDTREIEKIYAKNRLTRKDLVAVIEGLWELIDDHQQRCAYTKLKRLLDDLNGNQKDKALQEILELITYDARIRKLAVQKGGLDPEIIDFLFGRPLTETLAIYGITVKKQGDTYHLSPSKHTA